MHISVCKFSFVNNITVVYVCLPNPLSSIIISTLHQSLFYYHLIVKSKKIKKPTLA